MSVNKEIKKITTEILRNSKGKDKIAMLTAYDYTMAQLADAGGLDAILVGDSAANVMAGYETTLPITLEQMIYHAQCVVRGTSRALVVVDMPFGTYQSNSDKALESAIKIMKETNAQAVKLEGGAEIAEAVQKIVQAGIPVMAHLGLTPQSINQLGSYALRAKKESEAQKLKEDALLLQSLGVFALVLEKIPTQLAKEVTESLNIPTIGIGAGAHCDGQVLVLQDMLGMNEGFKPKFLRQYAHLGEQITGAVSQYVQDVKANHFPNESESY
ncbi:3-methyl-2-oxobutanoate hydroxymethyltransferase [Ornithobacterium rhinotracheale]|uniref:3-methyl-2-oxobutanoate hydroxymethyltransferase n=1 Tax=Ornithobacterium rhinotracheale TaxID=28251 RepID=UPI0038739D6E